MRKNSRTVTFILVMLLLVISGCSEKTSTPANPSAPTPNSIQSSAESKNILSENFGAQGAKNEENLTLENMLIYAIEDEYLAHAEYDYILTTYGDQKPFNNIIGAEEKHITSLTFLFNKYKITLPQDTAKEYIPHPESNEEGLKAGVQAEIDNIAMYESFLKQQLPDDVKSVFIQLRDGSKGHLNAFERSLEK